VRAAGVPVREPSMTAATLDGFLARARTYQAKDISWE
jgi:hypothetical protein